MKKLFLLFSLIFLLTLTNSVFAEIRTQVEEFNISSDGKSLDKTSLFDYELNYYLSNGEYFTLSSKGDSADFYPEEKIYCWSGCNLYPKFKIYKEEIKKNNQILSAEELDIPNGFNKDLNRLVGIYEEQKISYSVENTYGKLINSNLKDYDDFSVNWNGRFSTSGSGEYTFSINVTNLSNLVIDDIKIENFGKNTVKVNLQEGNHTLNLSYDANKNQNKPNLYWSKEGEDFSLILENNLIFDNGEVYFSSPVKSVSRFSASSIPESYPIDYFVYPSGTLYIPEDIENSKPTVLIHGLHGKYHYWNQIPEKLTSLDNDVWEFYYEDANVSNFMTAGLLKWGIDTSLSYYPVGTTANVVAHSMGNLVVLGYINNLGKQSTGATVYYSGNIQKLIMLAGPVQESYLANRVLKGESAGILCGFFVDPSDITAQAYLDLAVGSEFTWLINYNVSLNPNIDYLSITGSEGIPCIPDETNQVDGEPGGGNDGFVAVTSASMLDKGVPLVIFTYDNHANIIGQKELCGKEDNPLHLWIRCFGKCQDMPWWLGGASAWCHSSSKVEREVNIIDGFFRGQSVNTIKGYLLSEDYYIDPNNPSSNPYQKGSVVLKIESNNPINTLTLRNINTSIDYNLSLYKDTTHNTTTDNWFYFSDNRNLSDIDSKYGLTFPKGNYKIYVNGEKISTEVEIKGAQTTMKEISLVKEENYHLIGGEELTINVNNTNYYLRFSGSNTLYNTCKIRIIEGTKMEFIELKTGVKNQSTQMPLLFNTTLCDANQQILDFSVSYSSLTCIPLVINTTWSNRQNISCLPSGKMNQSRSWIQYDNNSCPNSQNQTFYEYQLVGPNYLNTTWTAWNNISCLFGDKMNQTRNLTQYDIFNCAENKTIQDYQANLFCDFCIPKINISMTSWQNVSCLFGDKMNQSRINISYDSNKCINYSTLNLEYENKTENEYQQTQFCDFCVTKIVNTSWSNWTNVEICTIKNIQNQSRFKIQYDNNSCGEIENQTIYEYQNVSCDFCNYTLKYTNWTDWQNQSECSNEIIIQNRSRVEYDSNYQNCYAITNLPSDLWNNGENKTYWDFKNESCENICVPNLIGSGWTDWENISCLSSGKMNQSRYKIEYDSKNCPESQNKTIYEYQAIEECENNSLSINYPNSEIYNNKRMGLNLNSNIMLSKLNFIDYSNRNPRWITLCTNCKDYNRTRIFDEGAHNITFTGTMSDGKTIINKTNFFIDSKAPSISKTEPRRNSFTNGSGFYIRFREENIKNIMVTFNPAIALDLNKCVESQRYTECYVDLNLSNYNNQEIFYYFVVEDIAENKDESKPTQINVDTTSPVLNNPNSFWKRGTGRYSNYIYFNMSITELNFDEAVLNYDYNGRAREKRLCSRLKYGECNYRFRLNEDYNDFKLIIKDEAGNGFEKEIIF